MTTHFVGETVKRQIPTVNGNANWCKPSEGQFGELTQLSCFSLACSPRTCMCDWSSAGLWELSPVLQTDKTILHAWNFEPHCTSLTMWFVPYGEHLLPS